MANRFTVEAVFRGVDRVTAPVTRIQNRIGKFTRSFTGGLKRINRGVDGMTRGIRRFATVGLVAFAATGAVFADMVNTGAKFEQTLVNAAAKFPSQIKAGTAEAEKLNAALGFFPGFIVKGTEEFKKLQAAAAEVGATTEFTATQSAEALNFLAMAGFTAESAIAALPGVVDLATVAQVDLGRATDIATDSLGAFNLLTDDSVQLQKNLARVSDLLVTTSISANTSLEQMFEALVAGAPVAIAAGQSMEDVAAMIGIMANAGIKGSKSGRSMKNMITNLAAPGSAAAKVLHALGVEVSDIDKNMNRGVTILARFGAATKDLGSAERIAAFNTVFGKIALAASVNLANTTDQVDSLSQKIKDNTGITQKMAGVMRDTFQGRMNSFKSAVESVKLAIFGLTEGPLSDLLDDSIAWVRNNREMISQKVSTWILAVVNNMDKIVSVLKKVGIALTFLFAFIIALKTLIAVMTIVNLVMAANPVVLITLAIIALIAAGVLLIVFWDEIMAILKAAPMQWKLVGLAIIALITGPFGLLFALTKVFPEQWEGIKDTMISVWDSIVKAVRGAVAEILELIDSMGLTKVFQFAAKFTPGALARRAGAFFGRGDDDDGESTASKAGVVSPSERTARSIEERSVTNTSEVTLRAEPGTSAEVTGGALGGGVTLAPSAGF